MIPNLRLRISGSHTEIFIQIPTKILKMSSNLVETVNFNIIGTYILSIRCAKDRTYHYVQK